MHDDLWRALFFKSHIHRGAHESSKMKCGASQKIIAMLPRIVSGLPPRLICRARDNDVRM
jgi:hypothetical protein